MLFFFQSEDLTPDFKMEFELYYTVLTGNDTLGITRTPMRPAMNLRTTKKSIAFKAPKFCLAGHAHLTVDDVKPGMVSKDLIMGIEIIFNKIIFNLIAQIRRTCCNLTI